MFVGAHQVMRMLAGERCDRGKIGRAPMTERFRAKWPSARFADDARGGRGTIWVSAGSGYRLATEAKICSTVSAAIVRL